MNSFASQILTLILLLLGAAKRTNVRVTHIVSDNQQYIGTFCRFCRCWVRRLIAADPNYHQEQCSSYDGYLGSRLHQHSRILSSFGMQSSSQRA